MAETVLDIVGKGLKYEERVELNLIQTQATGTILATIGGANWGPIGIPTYVYKDFSFKQLSKSLVYSSN